MSGQYATVVALNALFALTGWLVVRRFRPHALVAAFVSWMVASDFVQMWSTRVRGGVTVPMHGVARLAFHVEEAFALSWTLLFLAVCAHYFLRSARAAAGVVALWAITSAVVVARYPSLVGEPLYALYRRLFVVGLFAEWAIILFGVFRDRTLKPTISHLVVILYAATDMVTFALPLFAGYRSKWFDIRWINTVMVSLGIAAHLLFLLRPRLAEEASA